MPDLDTNADPHCPLESQLDAWGKREGSRLVEPAPRFLNVVRAANLSRLSRRFIGALSLAAVLALVALIALRPDTQSPTQRPQVPGPVATRTDGPRATTAGLGRTADVETVLDLLFVQPRSPALPPARPSDAYCAGCIDELLRI